MGLGATSSDPHFDYDGAVFCEAGQWAFCEILMVGLDAAGEIAVLSKLKLEEIVTTISIIGFNVETV
ncbi:hypothetical protein SLA2020_192220 [Shorea laevis]